MTYQCGRAEFKSLSGKKMKDGCDNCGNRSATMYRISLSKSTGEPSNLVWEICVTCRSHLENVFQKYKEDWDLYY